MADYRGQFKTIDERKILVYIEQDGSTYSTELPMSGNPVSISYLATPDNIYEPLRTSNATLRFLTENLPTDIFNVTATGSRVKIKEQTGGHKTIWFGYLQPCVYSQRYSDPVEELELEASDYLTHLQYFKYTPKEEGKLQIVSFEYLLDTIFDKAEFLDGGYSYMRNTLSKGINQGDADITVMPSTLWVSEANFFSTEGEPWTYKEILEEICKYLGWIAIQWGDTIYLFDPQSNYKDVNGNSIFSNRKKVNGKWEDTFYDEEVTQTICNLSQADIRETGTNISLSEVWNKITVRDNLYNIENMLPSLNEKNEKIVTNLNKKKPYKQLAKIAETGSGAKVIGDVFYRFYDHKDWKQKYYDATNLASVTLQEDQKNTPHKMQKWVGGNLLDYLFVPRPTQDNKPNNSTNPTFKRYLMLQSKGKPSVTRSASVPGGWLVNDYQYVPLIDTERVSPVIYSQEDAKMILSFSVLKQPWDRYTWFSDSGFPKEITHSNGDESKNLAYAGLPIDYVKKNINMTFKLRVNNKWWNGKDWQDEETYFFVECNALELNSYMLTSTTQINTSKVEDFRTDKGYEIALPSIQTIIRSGNDGNGSGHTPSGEINEIVDNIYFAVCPPKPSVFWQSYPVHHQIYGDILVNGSYWLTDISLKICKKGETLWADTDVVFENELNSNHIIQGPEIDLKLTSDNDVSYSYSTVGIQNPQTKKIHPARSFKRDYLTSFAVPEENIIEAMIKEYETPSIIQTMTTQISGFTPFDIIKDSITSKDYYVIGTDIDLAMEKQTITLFEKK